MAKERFPTINFVGISIRLSLQQKKISMANTKNAQKADRQAKKKREHNRYYGKTTRNAVRDLRAITDKEEAKKLLPDAVAMLDKLAKRNIIHKKKADNLKSGLMKKVNSLA